MKKLFAMILAIAMILTLAVPVMAADDVHSNHTIVITEDSEGHTFEAYQIFDGAVTTNAEAGTSVMTNISWGSGVNTTGTYDWGTTEAALNLTLVQALKSQVANPSYYNLYALIPDSAVANEADEYKDEADIASAVVDVLAKNNNRAHAVAFASIVNKYLTGTATATASIISKDVTVGAETVNGYAMTGLADGYYLVKESDSSNFDKDPLKGETATLLILQLVKDVVMEPKDSELTIDKDIIEGGAPVDACSNSIGDVIEFDITGNMPSNLSQYTSFHYEFVDTMSKGLTLDKDSITLYTINGDRVTAIDKSEAKADENDTEYLYEVVVTNNQDGTTGINVIIDDVLDIEAHADYTVTGATSLKLVYKATLNAKAEIGGNGNENKVYAKYTRDPEKGGYGTTIEDKVYVFTFELDVYKTATSATGAALKDVEFVLFRERQGSYEFAVLDGEDKVSEWVSYLDNETIANLVNIKQLDTTTSAKLKAPEGYTGKTATVLTTDANGKFPVIGLDLGMYYLWETKPLDGYNAIDPIEINITAEYDATNNTVKNLRIAVDGGAPVNGNNTTGVVATTVINNPGSELPSTGGVGTTLFYVFGGMMVVGALVVLISKKRMVA